MKTYQFVKGDSIILTAPSGGFIYLWSNGEIGQEVTVGDPGKYQVTVVGNDACYYVPDEFLVTVTPRPEIEIYGTTYPEDSNFDGVRHYGFLEVCQYESFDLRLPYTLGTTFTWSSGQTGNYIGYWELQSLGIGTHTVSADVDDGSGCIFTTDPFTFTIHELPSSPTISSDQVSMCEKEGKEFTFTIDNPDPELTYFWNTGVEGNQITAHTPGNYFVTAVNEHGLRTLK